MGLGGSETESGQAAMRAELAAVSRTPEFERAAVMRRLLEFLVSETLAGRGDALKAYSVAVDGLGRDPDFDSQSDSYPRVQVGRLRKMLEAHYARAGDEGPQLVIPSGRYRVDLIAGGGPAADPAPAPAPADDVPVPPRFSPVRSRFPTALVSMISLFVLVVAALLWVILRSGAGSTPMRPLSRAPVLEIGAIQANGPGARTLAGATRVLMEDALHRSWLVRLRAAPPAGAELTELDMPVYRLTAHVDTTGLLEGQQITFGLLDLRTSDQIWSHSVAVPPPGTPLAAQMEGAIAALIGPFGVIATHQRGLPRSDGRAGYACLLDYDSYFRFRTPALRQPVADCIETTLEQEPLSAPALAAASFLAYDPSVGGGEDAARGMELARRAVNADPNSADAHAADGRAALIAGQCVRGEATARRAVRLNPYNAEIAGLMGFLLFQCHSAEAAPMLQRAMALDPDIPSFYSAALMLTLLEQGKTQEAVLVADTLRPPGEGMRGQYAITQMIAASARGDVETARRHWAEAAQVSGAPADQPDRVLSRYFFSPAFRAKVIAYLAGAKILPGSQAVGS